MSHNKGEPFKIILCSGPRGGKSVIAKQIARWFSDKYKIYILDETARELFDLGLVYENNPYNAQKSIIKRQLEKEKALLEELNINGENTNETIIVFDRTCIDAETFLSCEEFTRLLQEEFLTENDISENLHGALVLHMESLAVSLPDYYEKRNQNSNIIRRESAKEAADSDKKIYEAYERYGGIFEKHVVIKATEKIEDKYFAVKKEILDYINS